MAKLKVSFVIPAYNEASRIQKTIGAITQHVPNNIFYEIIVVDHGSQDDTIKMVEATAATVLSHPEGTIASLRNHGAQNASGDILVFLDADVLLTDGWSKRFSEIASSLLTGAAVLTGSWVSVPNSPNWIEANWFKPLQTGASTHINSGHLIVAKKVFEELGGFDSKLETGEDFDISIRAKSEGIKIVDDTLLEAIHEGYPKTLKEYFFREFWHGKGDAQSLSSIVRSKVAVISMLFVSQHLLLVYSFFAYHDPYLSGAILLSIVILVFIVTCTKYKKQHILVIMTNTFLYYIYFWARAFSIVAVFGQDSPKKRER